MLSPPDADIIRRDPDLPGLAVLLDPEAFVRVLRARLPDAGINGASITYVRYKPGMNGLFTYRIETGAGPVTAYAKVHGHDAEIKLAKGREKEKGSVPSALGPGRIVLDEINAVVAFFPNDGKLRGLKELVDAPAWRKRLGELFPERPDLWECEPRMLAYKPERRYVAQLLAAGEPRAVLKYYAEQGFAQAEVNAKGFRSRGSLRVARVVGRSERRRVLAFEWLPGRRLIDAIPVEPGASAAAGRALAELHSQEPEGLLTVSREAESDRLRGLAEGIGFLVPRAAGTAASLARRLALSLMEDPPDGRPVHGDFYADQVLVDGDSAAILDLDRAARGDAASDVGRFLAHLTRDVLRGRISPADARAAEDGLLAGYRESAPEPDPRKVGLHTAAGLFGLAMDPFRLREPDWPERIEAILAGAQSALVNSRRERHLSRQTRALPGLEKRG